MSIFKENSKRILHNFSAEFESGFVALLSRRYRNRRVNSVR